MKRVLFVTNHPGFSKFNKPYMEWFKNNGWIVDNASPGAGVGPVDNQYDISIHRSPYSFDNIKAIIQLYKIIKRNKYNLIHCHTEMGGLVARLAGISARRHGTKIIYTAHNYPFYKGSSLFSWIIYYSIEKMLAPITDAVVAINQEDYEFLCHHKMAINMPYKIDGVGVNLERFCPVSNEDKIKLRAELGIDNDKFVVLYTAQFIPRKNHEMIIKAVPELIKSIPNLQIVFAGTGQSFKEMLQLADSIGALDYISFLGGRSDIDKLCKAADIHLATSKLEGQGINNIEAMACGCPLVISNVRGHRDVCREGNGFKFDLDKPKDMIANVIKLYKDKVLYHRISKQNIKDAYRFSVTREVEEMAKIYNEVLNN